MTPRTIPTPVRIAGLSLALVAAIALVAAWTAEGVSASASGSAPTAATDPADAPRIDSFEVRAIDEVTFDAAGGPVVLDRTLALHGAGFYGTSVGPFVHLNGSEAPAVELLADGAGVRAWLPRDLHGAVTVRVTNPDGRSAEIAVEL